MQISEDEKKAIVDNIKNFKNMNKLMRAILSLIINLGVDENDLHLLKVMFKQVDQNHKGGFTIDELKTSFG